ncbi:4-amino-4-deoxy-L-arabinose transferase-like glycosyltransferase [Luteibacter sp. Sphag1AF]|uniref:hypothetical protein n=1 Tax=Luteibacter sp. Sphag1AF TaxID=2587031 RepID=UPI0016127022|nr:hypothetical protein [Luteibacter sp. Sphag1AF]MBB3225421.1 4-amino-4-deoxy-L-arabinose transferase-like glycosyltransferase [Luteibacter sp. Sphag1AF]
MTQAYVDHPVRGDAGEYINYAWNIAEHGVFSKQARDTTQPVVPDSFRDPGYPLILAMQIKATPEFGPWYQAVMLTQCILGALTVMCYLLAARRWLPLHWLVAAGMLMAVWPHSVTLPIYIVSESLFAFLLAAAFACIAEATARRSKGWAVGGAAFFTCAALTNAVVLPVAPLLAIAGFIWLRSWRPVWITLLVASLAFSAPWLLRNAALASQDSAGGRAAMNFVQGSWPDYHSAYRTHYLNPGHDDGTLERIDAEVNLIGTDRKAGYDAVLHRLADNPVRYAGWYASKPALLWGWDIQMGDGDIYVYPTVNSPFRTMAPLRALAALIYVLNPLLACLALLGCVASLCRPKEPVAFGIASVLIFVTAVYTILQAEPRYAIAFRGAEMIMATYGMALAAQWVRRRKQRGLTEAPAH